MTVRDIWKNILATKYVLNPPQPSMASIVQELLIANPREVVEFQNGKKRNKIFHKVGTCAICKFVADPRNPYEGLFGKNSEIQGIIRVSHQEPDVFPSFALKFFDKFNEEYDVLFVPTVIGQTLALQTINNRNFMNQRSYTTFSPIMGLGLYDIARTVNFASFLASLPSNFFGEISGILTINVDKFFGPKKPYQLYFHTNKDLIQEFDGEYALHQVEQIFNGKPNLVMGWLTTDSGNRLGKLVIETDFVRSEHGDKYLHFRHILHDLNKEPRNYAIVLIKRYIRYALLFMLFLYRILFPEFTAYQYISDRNPADHIDVI